MIMIDLQSIGDWPGWKYPNPGLRNSQKILQKLIDETEQLCRGKAASKQWQVAAKHMTQTVSKRSDQNKNLIEYLEQVLSTLDKTLTVNQTTTGQCEKVMIEVGDQNYLVTMLLYEVSYKSV